MSCACGKLVWNAPWASRDILLSCASCPVSEMSRRCHRVLLISGWLGKLDTDEMPRVSTLCTIPGTETTT